MKIRLIALLGLVFPLALRADLPVAPAAPTVPEATDSTRLTAGQLEQLLGPIALYPDALIALILPAATAPTDVVLAARYLKDDGDPAEVASRSWDESVKSLVHYAEVVKWMDDNLSWTKQVGEAFRDQPAEVMQAIQRLRAKARAAGTLTDSPQQQVVMDRDVISIIPAQPNTIYVPYYDPMIVYAPPPEYYGYGSTSFITFSAPFAVGAWLRFDCDWRQRTVWTVDHHWAARDHHDWRHPVFPGQAGYVNDPNRHPWHPSSYAPRYPVANTFRRDDIARPAPINAPRPAFAQNQIAVSDRRNDFQNRPQRPDHRPRDPNFVGPIAAATLPTTTAPALAPAPAPTPTAPVRRGDFNRGDRYDSGNRANRPVAFQNPPINRSTVPVAAPFVPPSQPVSNYPFGRAPSAAIVPAFTGPVVPSMPVRAASQPQPIRMPAVAPAPAPAAPPPPPAAPPSENRRGANEAGEQRKQLN